MGWVGLGRIRSGRVQFFVLLMARVGSIDTIFDGSGWVGSKNLDPCSLFNSDIGLRAIAYIPSRVKKIA